MSLSASKMRKKCVFIQNDILNASQKKGLISSHIRTDNWDIKEYRSASIKIAWLPINILLWLSR